MMTSPTETDALKPDADAIEPFLVLLDGQAELLRKIIEPVLEGQGYELVQLHLMHGARSTTLRLYIDRKGVTGRDGDGIVMADLERANRLVGDFLDVEDGQRGLFKGHYDLEVSSPGVDRPLTKQSHFSRALDQRVRLKTRATIDGARAHSGTLTATNDKGITLVTDDDKTRIIPWPELTSANTVFVFEDAERPAPKRQKKTKATAAPSTDGAAPGRRGKADADD